MKHTASKRFWQCLDKLPSDIQALARNSFVQLKSDPAHPSLHFKTVGNGKFHSVRVGLYFRALGSRFLAESTGSGLALMESMTSSSANSSFQRTAQERAAFYLNR